MRVGRILRRFIWLLPSTCAAGSLFGACTFPDVQIDPAAECGVDADCLNAGLGRFCTQSARCVACQADGDCPDDEICSDDGHCGTCSDDAHCPQGFCVDAQCVACRDDGNCPAGLCVEATCVQCTSQDASHCDDTDICQQNLCVPHHCSDGVMNDGETDVDCGGSCAPCDDGASCMMGSDCVSGVCDAMMTCAACTSASDCDRTEYCVAGGCEPRKAIGELCRSLDACEQGAFCVGTICCETLCEGECMACSQIATGEPNGQCAQAEAGTKCTTRLQIAGECTEQGTCSVLPG